MTKKPFILIVNDDGIYAPGLKHLWKSLVGKVDLAIVAPAVEQSAVGLGITYRTPLHVEQIPWEGDTPAWKVNGTPADCVRMAISLILDRKPDLIVSGINKGGNPGRVVLYSGTVAGVIEGTLRQIPGVAFSHYNYDNPCYADLEKHVYPIVSHLLSNPLPQGTFLNVNYPDTPNIKGFKMARQGRGYFIEDPDTRLHPDGYPYYWMSGKWSHHEEHEESDVALLKEGYLTAVPIRVIEMTDHDHLARSQDTFSQLFIK
jgi:5'-nucleotidase